MSVYLQPFVHKRP